MFWPEAGRAERRNAGPRRRWRLPDFVSQILRALADVYALARDPDPRTRGAEAVREAELEQARRLADQWQRRAQAAEAQVAELEAELAASERMALELRSRIICLHGKLATSNATVRYQSMTLALESQSYAPEGADATQPE